MFPPGYFYILSRKHGYALDVYDGQTKVRLLFIMNTRNPNLFFFFNSSHVISLMRTSLFGRRNSRTLIISEFSMLHDIRPRENLFIK